MVLGTPADVRANARECFAKGAGNPKGYILGLGCALPINTPPENVHALIDAAWELSSNASLRGAQERIHRVMFPAAARTITDQPLQARIEGEADQAHDQDDAARRSYSRVSRASLMA